MKRRISVFVAVATWVALPVIAQAQAPNVTGIWRANDGGTYQIRQVGSRVWWYGRSPDGGRTFQNVFSGTVTASGQIRGSWGDLPPGGTRHSGRLILEVRSGRLVRVSATGGFGGSEWVRTAQHVVVRDHRNRDFRNGATRVTTTGSGSCDVNMAKALKGMNGKPKPLFDQGKADAGIGVPTGTQKWFDTHADPLGRVILRLAGQKAWNDYKKKEASLHLTSNVQVVQVRVDAITAMVQ